MKILILFLMTCLTSECQTMLSVTGQTLMSGSKNTMLQYSPIFTSYKQTVLNDNPTHFWLFDNASGTVPDYAGSVNLTVPTGTILGVSGIINTNSPTAAYIYETNGSGYLTGSTLGAFDYTNRFCYEFLFVASNTLASEKQYVLAETLKVSSPFNGFLIGLVYEYTFSSPYTWRKTLIPTNWFAIQFYEGDASSHSFSSFGCGNVTNGMTNLVDVNYSWVTNFSNPNGVPYIQYYLNGNLLETSSNAYVGPIGTIAFTNVTLFANYNSSSPFLGTVQSASVYNYNLSETQVLNHWLAFSQSSLYQPNQYLYYSFKGTDLSGNPLRISSPAIYWCASSNLYYVFGLGTTGTNINIPDGFDQTNVNQVTVYSTPNLCRGTFNYLGIALDGSVLSFLNTEIVRPNIMYNTNGANPYYVMWTRDITNYYTSGVNLALVATSTIPQGPYTIVATNLLLNGHNPGDFATFVDTNGTGYLVYAQYPNLDITALSSTYLTTSGSANVITTGQAEGVAMNRIGTNYYIIDSVSTPYDGLWSSNAWFNVASSPMGTWATNISLYANSNPYGTGLEGQTCSAFFQDAQFTNIWLSAFDLWHNGDLSASTTTLQRVNVVSGTNLVVNPSKTILLQ